MHVQRMCGHVQQKCTLFDRLTLAEQFSSDNHAKTQITVS